MRTFMIAGAATAALLALSACNSEEPADTAAMTAEMPGILRKNKVRDRLRSPLIWVLGSPGRIRTSDRSVNSRLLYH